ncbi:MAG: recombinase family protein [Spirochaetes bacterium]|nr:recombinase family protein [Spirochaetota bacterium]
MRPVHHTSEIGTTIIQRIAEAKAAGIPQDKWAFAYARVSTKHDEQQGSRENQKEDCEIYATEKGLFLLHTFQCSESAKQQGRKVFTLMLDTALSFQVKNIIIKDTSRLTRNLGDKEKINTLVKKEMVVIHFYLTKEILNHESRLLISNIFAVIDADFSEILSAKSKHAHARKKKKGIPIQLPMGLRFKHDNKSIIELDPEYEQMIKTIFELVLNHQYTGAKIEEQFRARGFRTKRGNYLHETKIYEYLKNKIYTGKWFRVKEKGIEEWRPLAHPFKGFITEKEYDTIQALINSRRLGAKHRREKPYLLTGLVRCSRCGRIASGNRPKDAKSTYYTHKCIEPAMYPKPYWLEKTLFEGIDTAVKAVVYYEQYTEMLKTRLKTLLRSQSTVTQRMTDDINKQLKKLEDRLDNLVDDRLDRIITGDAYTRKEAEINQSITALKDRQAELSVDLNEYRGDAISVIDAVREFRSVYAQGKREEKIKLLKEMIDEIVFDDQTNSVTINWKRPFNILLIADEKVVALPETVKSISGIILPSGVADGT